MILIIDFGSQYNQLIARRVRENRVFCQVEPPAIKRDAIKKLNPDGIILSGGPSSIYEKNSPRIDSTIFDMGIPILGICYGLHYMVDALGGTVKRSEKREYGFAELFIKSKNHLFADIDEQTTCWMSHGDSITKMPRGFKITASTSSTKAAALAHTKKKLFGVQFHPEVAHTPRGKKMLRRFLFDICECKRRWTMKNFANQTVNRIRETVGDQRIILGLSGGVDSSVTALLIHQAIGKKLTCIFVDNGILRLNEAEKLKKTLKQHLNINIRFVSAKRQFLTALTGVTDPEKKRKIIGRVFMTVFEAEAKKIRNAGFLAQGTLYPDIIESRSAFGLSLIHISEPTRLKTRSRMPSSA